MNEDSAICYLPRLIDVLRRLRRSIQATEHVCDSYSLDPKGTRLDPFTAATGYGTHQQVTGVRDNYTKWMKIELIVDAVVTVKQELPIM